MVNFPNINKIVENKDIIKSMSDDIYKNIILEYRDKHNYDSHISLANKP